jgi:hypothetical protein
MPDRISNGREAYGRRAWSDAYEMLVDADQECGLGVEDLERLATAAYLIGRETDFQRFLDRAYRAHLDTWDRARGARCPSDGEQRRRHFHAGQ